MKILNQIIRVSDEKGFSLIFAIFMLIIFGIIGASIITMLSTSSVSSSEFLLSTQALFLAESGAEIRIKQTLQGDEQNNKNYTFDKNKNFKINVQLIKIADLPNGKTLYSVYSKGLIFDVKRKIEVKFWK